MIVSVEHIQDYIPQRPPIVMVDEILEFDEKTILTSFHIKADNIFVEDGIFTESGLMENMAQSAASKVGYACKMSGKEVSLGFIGAISKVKIHDLPKVGAYIKTKIIFERTVFNVSLINAMVYFENSLVCECKMKIVVDNP